MGNIGVITDEQDYDERVRAFKDLASDLDKLDGVDHASADDWNPDYADTAQIYIEVEASKKANGNYDIKPNLRSLAQRIRSVIDDHEKIVASSVFTKPRRQYNDFDEPVGYDRNHYMIDVSTY